MSKKLQAQIENVFIANLMNIEEEIIDVIGDNCTPEEVFKGNEWKLEEWAKQNGYVKSEK